MYARSSATGEKDHSTVTGENLNRKTKLNVSEWLGAELSSVNVSAGNVLRGNYDITSLGKTLPLPYRCLCRNRFYKDDLIKLGSTLSDK